MLNIDSKTFNPEVLYVFDTVNRGPSSGKKHAHDFFELSILLKGESIYEIDDETHHLKGQTILIFNPGVYHLEYATENMENVQIHIGLRHFNFSGYERDFLPIEATIVQLEEFNEDFFNTCEEIIRERQEARPGHELVLKSLVYKLIVYLIRDSQTMMAQKQLPLEEQEKQQMVNDVKLYIDTHYHEDLSLDQLSEVFFTSPTTLTRRFKEFMGDTPINYLINYRLEKAKNLIQNERELSIKEVAESVGYEDALYFSKLFKKHYGYSPTFFVQEYGLEET